MRLYFNPYKYQIFKIKTVQVKSRLTQNRESEKLNTYIN